MFNRPLPTPTPTQDRPPNTIGRHRGGHSIFLPSNWYWIVNDSTTQVYSSAAGNYVLVSDPTYVTWLQTHRPTKIATEADLGAVFALHGLRPVAANVLSSYQDGLTAYFDVLDNIHRAAALVVMDEDNRTKVDIASMASAVAAATSLADLKTRFAAISFTPQRTAAQIKSAIRARLGT